MSHLGLRSVSSVSSVSHLVLEDLLSRLEHGHAVGTSDVAHAAQESAGAPASVELVVRNPRNGRLVLQDQGHAVLLGVSLEAFVDGFVLLRAERHFGAVLVPEAVGTERGLDSPIDALLQPDPAEQVRQQGRFLLLVGGSGLTHADELDAHDLLFLGIKPL